MIICGLFKKCDSFFCLEENPKFCAKLLREKYILMCFLGM